MYIKDAIVTDKFVVFWNSIFSNFLLTKFEYHGNNFNSSEQAFMWCKAYYFKDEEIQKQILESKYPKEAKLLGRKVKNFDTEAWNKVRLDIMVDVLLAKFLHDEKLKQTLLNTGERTFVEGSPYDKDWGIGIHWQNADCLDKSKWQGLNLLGQALDKVRSIIKEKS